MGASLAARSQASAASPIPIQLEAQFHRFREVLAEVRALGIDRILEAADAYFDATGRRVTYEYILIDGLNDRKEDAARLANLLAGRCALVNLIPYNPVPGLPFRRPAAEAAHARADAAARITVA